MKKITIYLFFIYATLNTVSLCAQTANKKESDFVEVHITTLQEDIQLTDSQLVEIRGSLQKLYRNWELSSKINNKDKMIEGKKNSYQEFVAVRDAILTEEQKAKLEQKAQERKEQGIIRQKQNNN